jgi:long-chain-fatty-acid--CoA ligase ACSBG
VTIISRSTVYFARPDALSGSLVHTLNYVQPTVFFGVPRVYEKFEDKIREALNKSNFIRKKIIKFSMKTGSKYIDNELKGKSKPFFYPIANLLMFKKIRKALGFQNCNFFAYGAAPMKRQTLDFFKSLGIMLHNGYGMSESTAPQFCNFDGNPIEIYTAGIPIPGTEAKIINPDKDGVGEICFRGRNRFMGYYKNDKATLETIDEEGFLHSGDQGYINKNGNLVITGRIKELIITAGGENVAPVPIEDSLKEACRIISNVVIQGDDKKYLAALITLKHESDGTLTREVLDFIKEINSDAQSIVEAINCDKIKFYIQKCIDEVNKNAVSRAQLIRKWTILPGEFSIDGGELTPTLKIKRKFVSQKYSKIIDKMYADPKF